MRSFALSTGAFALLAAFSLGTAARDTKSVTSDVQITCKDGTVSPSKTTRGACSGHGGIDRTSSSAAAKSEGGGSTSSSSSSSGSRSASTLGAGAGKVWANEPTKVYHCAGDPFYGKTKKGEFMSEAEAKDHGFRPDHGKTCAERGAH